MKLNKGSFDIMINYLEIFNNHNEELFKLF